MMNRRGFLTAGALLATPTLRAQIRKPSTLRFGLTPVILDNRLEFLRRWRAWLEARLGQPVRFVQRAKYREITDLLLSGQLDAAWICGYPYVVNKDRLRLLAVPRYQGGPWYRSYIIAGPDHARAKRLEDLRGAVFAFSDPDSNSGFLYAAYRLLSNGTNASQFFARSFFTWGHRNTVEAVAVGMAQAGSVDGYVWDQMRDNGVGLASNTRVIERSPQFGFPPLVTRDDMPGAAFGRLRGTLLAMNDDPAGRELLAALGLDGFTDGEDAWFAGIDKMARAYAAA